MNYPKELKWLLGAFILLSCIGAAIGIPGCEPMELINF